MWLHGNWCMWAEWRWWQTTRYWLFDTPVPRCPLATLLPRLSQSWLFSVGASFLPCCCALSPAYFSSLCSLPAHHDASAPISFSCRAVSPPAVYSQTASTGPPRLYPKHSSSLRGLGYSSCNNLYSHLWYDYLKGLEKGEALSIYFLQLKAYGV